MFAPFEPGSIIVPKVFKNIFDIVTWIVLKEDA